VDLGLRLSDVRAWDLQVEEVHYNADPTKNLKLNGASAEEIEFLCHTRSKPHRGQRVELNAFTSDQFVRWLDEKLTAHGVKKVIPSRETLEQAYRRAAGVRRYQQIIDAAQAEVMAYANSLPAPSDLAGRVAAVLADDPVLSWDQAVQELEAGDAEGPPGWPHDMDAPCPRIQ
jgi:hypothetical protein